MYSPAISTSEPSVKRPSPGVWRWVAQGSALAYRAIGSEGSLAHRLVHVEHNPPVSIFKAQQALCCPAKHAKKQETLIWSAQQVLDRVELRRG